MPSEEEKNAAYDSDAPSTDEDSEDDYIDEAEMKAPPVVKKGRRGTVMAAAVTVAPDWAPPVFDKSDKEKEDLVNSIGKNILFSELDPKELDIIISAMKRIEFKEGDNIIEQGAEGDLFYVVEEGECEIFVKGVGKFFIVERGSVICTKLVDGVSKTVSESLGPGDYFGELSLINNEDRAATVTAQEDTTCLTIDRKTFKRLLGPLEGMLREHQELYAKYVEDAKEGD
ncbi:hypothetical protein TrRE_jg8282 [Triparma retinervis]|uniref:Cyclic nucleotide-binding domain-containing protein n=1 Tax=Triparma retinervis TaxID=2557542 RepID=A0A9W7E5N2_9STRA|nr:hypothetical protein TrRE_jg8282 [Triparma retinervis]